MTEKVRVRVETVFEYSDPHFVEMDDGDLANFVANQTNQRQDVPFSVNIERIEE